MQLHLKTEILICLIMLLQIPRSNEGKDWFWYVDKTVTQEQLEQLTDEFLVIFDKCPSRLKKKVSSISGNQSSPFQHSLGYQLVSYFSFLFHIREFPVSVFNLEKI